MPGFTHPLLRRGQVAAVAAAGCLAVLPLAPAAAAPAAPAVINGTLQDVSCASASSCMAVGWAQHASGQPANITVAEQWNGSSWRVLPTPTPDQGSGGELLGVSCVSSSDCMAVGQALIYHAKGEFVASYPLAEHWNGTAWAIVPTVKLAHTGAVLNRIACTGADSCMAVGSEGGPKNDTQFTFAESWNGTAWKYVPTPAPLTPGGTALSAISCTSAASCMAAGAYGYNAGTGGSVDLTLRWNGTAWRRVLAPAPDSNAQLTGVSCAVSSACVAVGAQAAYPGTLAARWNGSRWKELRTPPIRQTGGALFYDVACPGRTACMAVGTWSDPTGEYGFTLAESWNGTSWTRLRTPDPGSAVNELYGISCPAAAECMAVGSKLGQTGNGQTLAETWNGTSWRVLPTPAR